MKKINVSYNPQEQFVGLWFFDRKGNRNVAEWETVSDSCKHESIEWVENGHHRIHELHCMDCDQVFDTDEGWYMTYSGSISNDN